ncbi:MAG: amidase domain-containing protein [Microthrixaceae bacterium]
MKRFRRFRKIGDAARGMLLGSATAAVILYGTAAPASAYPLRRDYIVAYANRFWTDYNYAMYSAYGNDCTNFVSQSWFGIYYTGYPQHLTTAYGGPENNTSSNPWYPGANSWSVAQAFVNYQNTKGPGVPGSHTVLEWIDGAMDTAYQQPDAGPARLCDYLPNGRRGLVGNYWTHAAILASWFYVGSYTERVKNVSVTYHATVDVITSHTANRYQAPWNIGFRVEQLTLDSTTLQQHKNNWDAIVMEL